MVLAEKGQPMTLTAVVGVRMARVSLKKRSEKMSRHKLIAIILGLTTLGAGTIRAAHAGAVGGAQIGDYIIKAQSTQTFNITFRGGEWASVIVEGDGDTDLDVYVYDSYGDIVASDTDITDYCVVRWFPRRTGTYRIVVRNLGSVWNLYTLLTN